MLADVLQSMIDHGMVKPGKEPEFFVYPSAYAVVPLGVSYEISGTEKGVVYSDAELERRARRNPR